MTGIQSLLLFIFFSLSAFSQEEDRNAHLVFRIRNEKEEIFKGTIRLIANNDTINLTASWNNAFRADLLPGTYRLVLQNKLFDNYVIPSLELIPNETKELEILWEHRRIVLPEIVFHL